MDEILIMSSVHCWNDVRMFHREANSLAENGYKVKVIAVETDTAYTGKHCRLNVETIQKIPLGKRYKVWYRFYHIARISPAKIIIFHDPELYIIAYFLKKFTNKKIIFDMHEEFPASLLYKKVGKYKLPRWVVCFLKKIEQRILPVFDGLFFAEAYYKDIYGDVCVQGIDVLNYPVLCKETNNLKVDSDVVKLIYAGALHEVRGFFEMLELARLLKEGNHPFSLKIIGPGSNRLIEQGQEYINKHGLREYVSICPYMDFALLELEYQKADIGLALLHETPNYVKSLASKLYEYMSYGIVSVASDFPLWKELLMNTDAGITVNPMNINEVYYDVVKLINEVPYRKQLAKNGLKAHVNDYNWGVEEAKILRFIQQLET
ncbi:hypothetical protein UE46_00715 [Listeria weihenstephanensis]|uniref:Glycosyl transferase family 1 domain-containing protein n=2 Tax=Listeria weihenstephanensis TaxID=1006155 RepID=A0A1S7FQK8_9LIST|nr:glycosyltransferase [Listeria weihenstephanensis]AQY49728.1 hypothetical protein UE46_00715 [Listeria weihenstephanensis]